MQKRLRIRRKDLRYVIGFFIIMTVIVSTSVYFELNPAPTDQFFSMSVLGSDGLTENYFPNNNANLILGETVNWTLDVYNHMSALEYVVIRVKLLNSTETGPNEMIGVPSSAQPVFEVARILTKNETWAIPFIWAILRTSTVQGNVQISGITINQAPITGYLVEAGSGLDYRFVFELWFYDQTAGDLAFSWASPTGTYSVWTQLWFNVTATS